MTLLIGGPKHGEFINLPEGQDTYEFTENFIGAPWPESREYLPHRYTLDRRLEEVFPGAWQHNIAVFVHEVIADERHGGSRLINHVTLTRSLEEATQALREAKKHSEGYSDELTSWQERYEALLAISNDQTARLRNLRRTLEFVGVGVTQALVETGRDYEPITKRFDAD